MMKRFTTLFIYLSLPLASIAQNVGIGTTNPWARLHVADSSVVFTGPQPLPFSPRDPTIPREGNRMFWYADKAALLVGGIGPFTPWNKNDIGKYSFASGYDIKAVADFSSAFGESTKAYGNYSIAMGRGTQANGLASLVIGLYNDTLVAPDRNVISYPTTPLFIVGNGFNLSARSNALVVYKSGNTTISGFTQLGETTQGAPLIKMKELAGTTSSINNGSVSISHGLNSAKIISVQALVEYSTGNFVPTAYTYAPELHFNYLVQTNGILVVNNASACTGTSICNKPVKILITYKE
jgi:hypothetical protein